MGNGIKRVPRPIGRPRPCKEGRAHNAFLLALERRIGWNIYKLDPLVRAMAERVRHSRLLAMRFPRYQPELVWGFNCLFRCIIIPVTTQLLGWMGSSSPCCRP